MGRSWWACCWLVVAVGCRPTPTLLPEADAAADVARHDATDEASVDASVADVAVTDVVAPDVADVADAPDAPDVADVPDVPDVADVPDVPAVDAGSPAGYTLTGGFVSGAVQSSGAGLTVQGSLHWYGVVGGNGGGYSLEGRLQ